VEKAEKGEGMKNYRTIKVPECCCSCKWLVIEDYENFCSQGFDREDIKRIEKLENITLTIEDFIGEMEPIEAFGLCDDYSTQDGEFKGAIK